LCAELIFVTLGNKCTGGAADVRQILRRIPTARADSLRVHDRRTKHGEAASQQQACTESVQATERTFCLDSQSESPGI
jgi:hypothetical protein